MQGTKYRTAKTYVDRIWRVLISSGKVTNTPRVYRKGRYGVPVLHFPSPLREEVLELLRWKSVDHQPGRPKKAKIRQVSASRLEHTFRCLYGYAIQVAKRPAIETLSDLLQKQIIDDFVQWFLNERKNEGSPLVTRLAMVLAAVSKHPTYRSLDWAWFKQILDGISFSAEEEVKARKAQKYLDYSVLEKIPAKILAVRESLAKNGKDRAAPAVAAELLFRWLLLLPWRQRNIRECRVEGPKPNLFRGPLSPFSYVDRPAWVQEEQAQNPEAVFWQFRFSKEETKTGVAVHALVPRPLLALLEEYLLEYRPYFLRSKSCETLFVSSTGSPLDSQSVNEIVSDQTLRHGGRRVTPHLFRDIVAFAWLKAHSKDYLTLSKMLWHKNVETTIRIYGSRFNESSGVCAMEAWVEEREGRMK
jgi:integrase